MSSLKTQIIQVVNTIPYGKVMAYGQIGKIVGVSGQLVGFTLSGMPQTEWESLPWHRVVAKDGFISSLKLGAKGLIQIQLLLDEGVKIQDEKVDMLIHNTWEQDQDILL